MVETLRVALPPEPGVPYPICVGGKLQGPPEDCGGIPGCCNLLEAVSGRTHHQQEETLEWVGGDFDPEAFSVDDVKGHNSRREVSGSQRASAPRHAPGNRP